MAPGLDPRRLVQLAKTTRFRETSRRLANTRKEILLIDQSFQTTNEFILRLTSDGILQQVNVGRRN
jgi:hypothetical protein